MTALQHYHWPGNIRELVNVIERAQILAEDNLITIDDLPDNMIVEVPPPAPSPGNPTAIRPAAGAVVEDAMVLRDVERRHVREILQRAGQNKVQAAKMLGISRRALYRLIAKYRLDADEGVVKAI